jgi:hypothetical protein
VNSTDDGSIAAGVKQKSMRKKPSKMKIKEYGPAASNSSNKSLVPPGWISILNITFESDPRFAILDFPDQFAPKIHRLRQQHRNAIARKSENTR